jgi:3D-(3,5/4)-trihydroxycyclohexane-1,2-dione acylhydrolase (decyclizing)
MTVNDESPPRVAERIRSRVARARAIVNAGGVQAALDDSSLPRRVTLSVAEAVVIALLKQDVRIFIAIFGHGSTELAEVLRVYEGEGALRTHAVRNEVEAAHIATALRWATGEKAAVVTSIGPGALQAMAGSLAAASDGLGVWHIYADETTEAEGPNMQQLAGSGQEQFLKLVSQMGEAYSLHTPWALAEAMRRGLNTVDHPHRGQPFYLLLPINVQPQTEDFNLAALPSVAPPPLGPAVDDGRYEEAAKVLLQAERVVIKAGGGSLGAREEIARLAELIDGFVVTSPTSAAALSASHPRNVGIGGSKGTISGNRAMERADVLLAIGTRGVCQADMSRTGYPLVTRVVNVNTDTSDVSHYNHTIPLQGDAAPTLRLLISAVESLLRTSPGGYRAHGDLSSDWAKECLAAKDEWTLYKAERYSNPVLHDEVWGRNVLTQPAAIETVTRWARDHDHVAFFDAGDVQANGFQIVEDDRPGQTITETGASYMGFATSAVVATGIASTPFRAVALTGDGSFTMNPQALIDGVQHGAQGIVVLFDNRRQGAISSLQRNQYGVDYATNDAVEVDYRAWAAAIRGVTALHGGHSTSELEAALDEAAGAGGLALIHVPVYFGDNPLGGMGSFGRWNVGSWVETTSALRHELEI